MEPVLVVGAGPTGLVAALGLARRGVAVRIIDRKDRPANESRAMGVQARTLEYYRQLGFGDAVADLGVKAGTVHFRTRGRDVVRFTLGDMGAGLSPYPYLLCFAQDEHERFLIDRLHDAGVSVDWGAELQGLVERGDRVEVDIARGAATDKASYSYVIGCDGAYGKVRERLGIGFPGGTYDQLFYVADARVSGGQNTDVYANLGASGVALMMPVRSSGMQRLIGLVPPEARSESPGWDDIRPQVESLLGVQVDELNWFSTYRVHHRVAAQFRKGRVFIAGDAGHIHSPTGGQGMNTGIGDAINLSWKLAEVWHGRADPALLATYEQERMPFAQSLIATTDRAFQYIVKGTAGARFVRTHLLPRALAVMARFATTRRKMFKTVSQIRITYRDSALSEGKAGDIHAGDRLPWIRTSQGDNFSALQSLGWQLHIYGDSADGIRPAASTLSLPVHHFDWSDAAAKVGVKRGAAYLVRPDGHVALAQDTPDANCLSEFVQRWRPHTA